MISPNKHSQAGISLLLTILVLAAITTIAVSLSTIVIIEIRAAADLKRTEPNLYATLGVTEFALFKHKRGVPDDQLNLTGSTCFPVFVCQTPTTGVSLSNTYQDYDKSPRVQVIRSGEQIVIPFYTSQDNFGTYKSAEVSIISQSSFPNGVSAQFNWATTTATGVDVLASLAPTFTKTFDANRQYDLVLNNGSNQSITILIKAYDASQEKGLPFLGQKVLDIQSQSSRLTRTYRVQIPVP